MNQDRSKIFLKPEAKLSAKLSNQQKINNLIKHSAKNAKLSYSIAKQQAISNPISAIERRVLKKIRPSYSLQDYQKLLNELYQVGPLKKLSWLLQMDRS